MVLKLVPITIEGVITRLVQERRGSRPRASVEEWQKILSELAAGERAEAVRAEREAILKVIESKRANYANVYFGDNCLRTVAAAIRVLRRAMSDRHFPMASGRWAVNRPGRLPGEITSGDLFRVEVGGESQVDAHGIQALTGRRRSILLH
jgi:hypothetical protein